MRHDVGNAGAKPWSPADTLVLQDPEQDDDDLEAIYGTGLRVCSATTRRRRSFIEYLHAEGTRRYSGFIRGLFGFYSGS